MRVGLLWGTLFLLGVAGLAQRYRSQPRQAEGPQPAFPSGAEFHFIRLEYTDLPEHHRYFGFASRGATGERWCLVDGPDADTHFTLDGGRLTRVTTGNP